MDLQCNEETYLSISSLYHVDVNFAESQRGKVLAIEAQDLEVDGVKLDGALDLKTR